MFIVITDPRSSTQLLVNAAHVVLVTPEAEGTTILSVNTGRTDLTTLRARESFEDICMQLEIPVVGALGGLPVDSE
jgi:hypothetical protein